MRLKQNTLWMIGVWASSLQPKQTEASKLAEEQLYSKAAEEVASGQIRQGPWAKALAEADCDESAAKGRYLKLRVEIMRAEADVVDYAIKQGAKDAALDAEANKPL